MKIVQTINQFQGREIQVNSICADPNMCPGITMGSASVELILSKYVAIFNWKLPSRMKPEDSDMEKVVVLTKSFHFAWYLSNIDIKLSNPVLALAPSLLIKSYQV